MEANTSFLKSLSFNKILNGRLEVPEHRNKRKRRSELPKTLVKKRGVYVEREISKSRLFDIEANAKQDFLTPPRLHPKVNHEEFLPSILAALSRTTTGTYDLDIAEDNNRIKRPLAKNPNDNIENENRYRSSVLNKISNNRHNLEDVIILQPSKNIAQTPSRCSGNESSLRSVADLGFGSRSNRTSLSAFSNSLAERVLEGKQLKKRVRIDEPVTLVGTHDTPTENSSRLYNIFVDLLEDTVNVHNMEAESTQGPKTVSGARRPPKPEEYILNKPPTTCECVQIKKDTCSVQKTRFHCYNSEQELVEDQRSALPSTVPSARAKTRRLKAKSFSFMPKPLRNRVRADTVNFDSKKVKTRRQRKKVLINLFKEQLSMDGQKPLEPQNLYEALKVMAQNKRERKLVRCKDMGNDHAFPEYTYPIRGVSLLTSNRRQRRPKKSQKSGKIQADAKTDQQTRSACAKDSKGESDYSLKVVGFDYESPGGKARGKKTQLELQYHSSRSESDYSEASVTLSEGFTSPSLDIKNWFN